MESVGDNPIRDLINQIQGFILNIDDADTTKTCHLVQQNTDKLHGDFCFPNDESIWSTYKNMLSHRNNDGHKIHKVQSRGIDEGRDSSVATLCTISADSDSVSHNDNDGHNVNEHSQVLPRLSCSKHCNVASERRSNDVTVERKWVVGGGCNENLQTCIYNVDDLIAASKHWTLKIDRVTCISGRCILNIDRRQTFNLFIRAVLQPNHPNPSKRFGYFTKQGNKVIKVTSEQVQSDKKSTESLTVTEYRESILKSVLENLINASEFTLLSLHDNENSDGDASTSTISGNVKSVNDDTIKQEDGRSVAIHHIHLTTKSSSAVPVNVCKIIVGNVLDPQRQNKLATTMAIDYIK